MTPPHLSLNKDLQKKVDFARNQTAGNKEDARLVMSCLDLTSLHGRETKADILKICDQAIMYNLAAVCVYPEHVVTAARALRGTGVHTATVINFPHGDKRTGSDQFATIQTTTRDVAAAVKAGATQIDIVQVRDPQRPGFAQDLLQAARVAMGNDARLKSILETAAYHDARYLADSALIAISSGVDCLKTSTGKHPNGGATLEAAAVLLQAIKTSRRSIGVKITGGLSTLDDCLPYLSLKRAFSGWDSVRPDTMRFGSSRLLDNLVAEFNTQSGAKSVLLSEILSANDRDYFPK